MRTITYMEAVREAIREEMRGNPHSFMIGEDVGPYGGEMGLSKGLWEEFGEARLRDAPISEAGIVGCALGAALTGCRAIAEIPFCDFIGVAMDQVYNQAAKMRYMFGGKAKIPLIIRTPIGGYQSAAAQHSQCLEAWFMHAPGIKKEGKDVTVVATSYTVRMALEAAQALAGEGIQIEVIDPRTLVPLDEQAILASVRKTGRLIVVHEAWRRAGAGAEIAAIVAEKGFSSLKAPIARVAAEDVPIPFSPVLEQFVLPNAQKIILAVRKAVKQ